MKDVKKNVSMHETDHSKLVHWDNPEVWMGRKERGGFRIGGTYVYLWPIHDDVWQKPSGYYKVITLQLK